MDILKINMLGEFSITYKNKIINEKSRRAKKMLTLLQYLITYHNREISQSELIELLWAENSSENPTGALKTSLHRLRAMLSELELPEGQDIIVNSAGTYAFNNALECEIDFDIFESLYKKSVQALSEKEKTALYLKAIEIYKGDFLPKAGDDAWVAPMNKYYHALYVRIVREAVAILERHKRYEDIIGICRKAILIEKLDDSIHYNLIKSLLAIGDKSAAKAHYSYVMDLFYNQNGINPSPELVALYEQTLENENALNVDLDSVKEILYEKDEIAGAFFCEYEFFKHIYQLEIRDAERYARPVHICLITVTDKNGMLPDPRELNKTMNKLIGCIKMSLRSRDVFARYSASQFIILLPNINGSDCETVLGRINSRYTAENPKSESVLNYKYDAV